MISTGCVTDAARGVLDLETRSVVEVLAAKARPGARSAISSPAAASTAAVEILKICWVWTRMREVRWF